MDHHWLNIKEKLKKWKRYVKKGLIITNIAMWYVGFTKDSFITQDRNEQIKGVKVEATFSRGHISLI